MAIHGGLDRANHFSEFADPIETQAGVISSATRKATALANLGLTATAAEINAGVDGLTATAAEINTVADGVLATAAEVNRVADVSTRLVTIVADTTIDEATHEGKTLLLGEVGGDAAVAVTLPAATGSGAKYPFIVSVLNTSGYTIKVANGTDVMKGSVNILDNDAAAQTAYAASGTDDTITLNGTTKGGQVGDIVVFEDILAGVWHVRGQLVVPAGSNPADVFSATVA